MCEKDHSDCISWEFCFEDLNCQNDSVLLEERFCFDCKDYICVKEPVGN